MSTDPRQHVGWLRRLSPRGTSRRWVAVCTAPARATHGHKSRKRGAPPLAGVRAVRLEGLATGGSTVTAREEIIEAVSWLRHLGGEKPAPLTGIRK